MTDSERHGDLLSMLGQTVAHYHILEKVGSGGMGVVYKARVSRLSQFILSWNMRRTWHV